MRLGSNDVLWRLLVVVFSALPVLGLVAGPTYAPLVFGLGAVLLLHGLIAHRKVPELDTPLLWLAAAFVALCWMSGLWSIAPERTTRGALQITAIFLGALIFLGYGVPAEGSADRLFRAMQIALALGAAIVALDALTGDRLQPILTGRPESATKYSRGIDYLLIVIWPLLGHAVLRRSWRWAIGIPVLVGIIVISGRSSTALASGLIGAAVLAVALSAPRLVMPGLLLATAAIGAALPFALRLLTAQREMLMPYIKHSLFHRLEIWDYMTARILERPWSGRGFLTAKAIQLRPDELRNYRYLGIDGLYPHNQWLECWVELGLGGAVLAVAFCALALRRAQGLRPEMRPFAFAAFAAAIATSLVNFETATDSWWAALAACAFLLRAAGARDGDRRAG
jgi:exopolysaccharide production protein ExoQ